MVTRAQLYALAPGARRDIVEAIVQNWSYAIAAGLTTPKRVRPFFANICGETGGLTILEEDMNYKTPERIQEVWPKRFLSLRAAAPFVGQPVKLANEVYGGRMGNAPAPSNDGWKYRGGGLLQASGYDEYLAVGYADKPDVLRKNPVAAFKSAVDLWRKYKLNALADLNQTTKIRLRINGGRNGMELMKHYLAIAKEVWPDDMDLSRSDPNEPVNDYQTVLSVQKRLLALGYTEVGFLDGEAGSFTDTAVTAFRSEHGLPPGGIDAIFLDELAKAKPRVTSRATADLSNSTIRTRVPEVMSAFYNKIISVLAAIVGFFGMIFNAIKDNFDNADMQLGALRQYFYDVPGWAWCGLVMIVAVMIYLISQQGEKSGVKAYQTGQRR